MIVLWYLQTGRWWWLIASRGKVVLSRDGVRLRNIWVWDRIFFSGIFISCVRTHTHTHTIHMRGKNGKLSLNKSPSGRLMTPLKSRVIFVLWLLYFWVGIRNCARWVDERRSMGPLKWLNLLATLNWLPVFHLGGKEIQSKWQKTTSGFWIPSGGKISNLSQIL